MTRPHASATLLTPMCASYMHLKRAFQIHPIVKTRRVLLVQLQHHERNLDILARSVITRDVHDHILLVFRDGFSAYVLY